MSPIVQSVWALLFGVALLMLGNGLQGTFLGLRASLEGFSTATTGLIMSAFYVGFVFGSLYAPRLVRRVGHVRVFAALASIVSSTVLLHLVIIDPWAWSVLRLISGFCFAGLLVITESWLNDRATNETRGQLLSVYVAIMLLSMAVGQFLLNVADPGGFMLFLLTSVLVSLALVPTALSAAKAPEPPASVKVDLPKLYATSPLGVVGCFLNGVAFGAFFGLGAVYGTLRDLSVVEISVFMAVCILAGAALQWPIGRLSDRFDRRQVLTGVAIAAAALAALAALLGGESFVVLLLLAALYGGISMPIYSVAVAHTNDFTAFEDMVATSSGMVLIYGAGSALGPILISLAMDLRGPDGFFWFLAAAHVAIVAFALYRMTRREARPLDEQRDYVAVGPRGGSYVAATLVVEEHAAAEEAEDQPASPA